MKKMPGGFGGGANMNQMIKQAQKLQAEMAAAQEALKDKEFEVSAGGGAVTIKITGERVITSIELSPDVVDPDDIETLCDILTAGVNEAIRKVDDHSESEMKRFTGGMNMPGMF